jgi:hypothetical protein
MEWGGQGRSQSGWGRREQRRAQRASFPRAAVVDRRAAAARAPSGGGGDPPTPLRVRSAHPARRRQGSRGSLSRRATPTVRRGPGRRAPRCLGGRQGGGRGREGGDTFGGWAPGPAGRRASAAVVDTFGTGENAGAGSAAQAAWHPPRRRRTRDEGCAAEQERASVEKLRGGDGGGCERGRRHNAHGAPQALPVRCCGGACGAAARSAAPRTHVRARRAAPRGAAPRTCHARASGCQCDRTPWSYSPSSTSWCSPGGLGCPRRGAEWSGDAICGSSMAEGDSMGVRFLAARCHPCEREAGRAAPLQERGG